MYASLALVALSWTTFTTAIQRQLPLHVPEGAYAQSARVDGIVPVEVRLLSEAQTAVAGQALRVGVHFTLAPGWHIYWQNPGGTGFPTEVQWQPTEAKFGPMRWPPPRLFRETEGIVAYGYANEALLVMPAEVSSRAKGSLTLAADVRFLACNTICSPGSVRVQRTVPIDTVQAPADDATLAAFAQVDQASALATSDEASDKPGNFVDLLRMLGLALFGGLLLNLMPCVLPVLAMKAFGLISSNENAKHAHRHALLYSMGVVGSMLALAITLVTLRSLGHQIGWGFQFQSPGFVAALAGTLVVLSLNCFGAFEWTVDVGRVSLAHERAQGLRRSFLEGILAVLVATPCSAPALGTAVAFALAQPTWVICAIFATIGLGLALPWSLLVVIPGLRRLIPRPGPWMANIKGLFGFALLATALWLVWLFARLTDADALAHLLALLWLASLGAVTWAKAVRDRAQLLLPGLLAGALVLSILAQTGPLRLEPTASSKQQRNEVHAYSAAAVQHALSAGHPVLVEFTADWCITCKYNERQVVADSRVQAALAAAEVTVLQADWTRRDPSILAELVRHGRAGVPMALLYSPKAKDSPTLLPEVLTVTGLLEALHAL